MANISGKLITQIPEGLVDLLHEIGEIATTRRENAYLAGGMVRDAILERPNHDLDIVIEGKAISLALQLAKTKDWKIRKHPRFGTAKLTWRDFSLDLITARSEFYSRPGALPTVERGTVQDDLARRDFTINAMSVHLNPDSFGELLDPHNGQGDLQEKLIRILHMGSFSDDPTRIFRALRYEQRLGFRLEQETEMLLRNQLDSLMTITVERLWHELDLILREEYPEKTICRADELGVLQQLHPAFKGDKWLVQKYVKARNIDDETFSLPSIYLSLLCYRFSDEQTENVIKRLKMPGWASRALRDMIQIKQSISHLDKAEFFPSDIYLTLQRHTPESVMSTAITSDSPVIQERLELYLTDLRYVKLILSGKDLQKMGIIEGKRVGQVLWALHAARLDKKISNLEEEKTLARELLRTST